MVELVQKTECAVVITERGRAAAVLLDCATYEGLLATCGETAYSDWSKRLARAEKESQAAKGVALEDYASARSEKPRPGRRRPA